MSFNFKAAVTTCSDFGGKKILEAGWGWLKLDTESFVNLSSAFISACKHVYEIKERTFGS